MPENLKLAGLDSIVVEANLPRREFWSRLGAEATPSYLEHATSPFKQWKVVVPDDEKETVVEVSEYTAAESIVRLGHDPRDRGLHADAIPLAEHLITGALALDKNVLGAIEGVGTDFSWAGNVVFGTCGLVFGGGTTVGLGTEGAVYKGNATRVSGSSRFTTTVCSTAQLSNSFWMNAARADVGCVYASGSKVLQETNLVNAYVPFIPTFRVKDETERIFESLMMRWRNERVESSSGMEVFLNDAYQKIIGLGERAVPLILRELERGPDHWFWALVAITRQNPVPNSFKGNMTMMRQFWLNWGQRQGYEW